MGKPANLGHQSALLHNTSCVTFFLVCLPSSYLATIMVKIVESLEDFQQALKDAGDKAVLVDFFADWCGPCKMIAPKLEAMSSEFTNMVFLKVNVDDNEETAGKYDISAMPTFLIFKNEQKVDSLVGASEAKLRELATK